ncbi:hypothetical protein EK21DRAFT_85739 [Setomelanomma holmii]|uniref:J domain-containing protein n=1 Tax=Setomelanomma holmii TaxID=210430 RepID=A0A9P4HH49_9PLEO|nr:hypothetical protein EK21DRAFT_85739 [Setomelanomma holmii]
MLSLSQIWVLFLYSLFASFLLCGLVSLGGFLEQQHPKSQPHSKTKEKRAPPQGNKRRSSPLNSEDRNRSRHPQNAAPKLAIKRPVERTEPDHYFNLGVTECATLEGTRRSVRAAFGVLKDSTTRATYDRSYDAVKIAWRKYRADLVHFKRLSEEERQWAEELAREAERDRQLREYKAAQDRDLRRKAQEAKHEEKEDQRRVEEVQRREEKQARAAQREQAWRERERQAEERTRQAAERAELEREKTARCRLRKLREHAAEARSAKVAERARLEQTKMAKERLARWQVEDEA